jgi:polyhydroxyalkanoate synthesis regulator phasin
MAHQDFDQFIKDIFGESINRVSGFTNEQGKRLMSKATELAREALKEDLARLQTEINELRSRVAVLEAERVQASSEQV